MPQLEYGDYYKFVVSCGIGLLLVAVGIPWLFLREPFDLLIEMSKLNSMTPLGRDVVLHRQIIVACIIRMIPYISSISGVGGIGLTLYGLIAWRKRQSIRDRTEDVTLGKFERELEQMSEQQVLEKVRAEVAIQESNVALHSTGAMQHTVESAVEDYLQSENTFLDILESRLPAGYTLLRHQQSMSYRFDAVLLSPDTKSPEFMIEFKKLAPNENMDRALEALHRVSLGADWANFDSKKMHLPMLVLVAEDLRSRQLEEISEDLRASADNPTAIGSSLIRVISPGRLKTLSAKDIQAVLNPSQRLVFLANDLGYE